MKIKSFIFVHDQKIILDYIRQKKFSELENLNFVFLGYGDVQHIQNLPNIIICRNLPINIENYPKLTSFTGWYAIWKNNLYLDSDYINLFEYDINLSTQFNQKLNENLNHDLIGYIGMNIHRVEIFKTPKFCDLLIESTNKTYGIDVLNYINKLHPNKEVSMTSNHTMKNDLFKNYMKWVEPLIDQIKSSNFSGHQIERSVPLFNILHNCNFTIIENILEHLQLDSHHTQYKTNKKYTNWYGGL